MAEAELIGAGAALAVGGAILLVQLLVSLAVYLYIAFALMTIARKLGEDNAWFAFVPILNGYLAWKVSQTPVWSLILGFIIPFFAIYWVWKIAERRNFPGPFALLMLVPVVNLVVPGVLAWVDR